MKAWRMCLPNVLLLLCAAGVGAVSWREPGSRSAAGPGGAVGPDAHQPAHTLGDRRAPQQAAPGQRAHRY